MLLLHRSSFGELQEQEALAESVIDTGLPNEFDNEWGALSDLSRAPAETRDRTSMTTRLTQALRPCFRLLESVMPVEAIIRLQHLKAHGSFPRLNPPVTFNEKLQWRKLHDRNPVMPILVDKIDAKSYVAKIVGAEHTTPTYWIGTDKNIDELRTITSSYVLKASHTSGDVLVVREPSKQDFDDLKRMATCWLRRRYSKRSGEWAYQDVRPRLLAEELLGEGGAAPIDYKFFCFNGRVRFIQIDLDRFTGHRRLFLDGEWIDTGITYAYDRPQSPAEFRKPDSAENLVAIAEAIASSFDFCRVDLYDIDGFIRFGEITFYPEGGLGRFSVVSQGDEDIFSSWVGRDFIRPTPRTLDVMVGKHWKLTNADQ